MKPRELLRRWQRRTRQLLDQSRALHAACRNRGTPAEIHDLRVTVRRLKVLVKLARPAIDPKIRSELERWAAQISQATSATRDLDVAIEWLQTDTSCKTIATRLSRLRKQTWGLRQRTLGSFPRRLRKGLRLAQPQRQAARSLAKRMEKSEARFRSKILEGVDQFATMAPENRHDFRRQIRRWRYLVELRLARVEQAANPLLATLLKVQETIGDEQNRLITEASLRTLPSTKTSAPITMLTRVRRRRSANERAIDRALKELANGPVG